MRPAKWPNEKKLKKAPIDVARLDVVGQTIDDVVKRAEQEVYRQRRENPRAELPDIKVPSFLQKVEATLNGTVPNPE